MPLPKTTQQRLASEYRFAADRMAATPDMPSKMYFFSVFFGEATRMLNQSWDAELALVQLVTQAAYREINARVDQARSGQDQVIGVNEMIPVELLKASGELASVFEDELIDGAKLLKVLSRIAELSYLASGNGNYLFLKGHIKL